MKKLLILLLLLTIYSNAQGWKVVGSKIYPINKFNIVSLREGLGTGFQLGYTTTGDSGYLRYNNKIVQFYDGSIWNKFFSTFDTNTRFTGIVTDNDRIQDSLKLDTAISQKIYKYSVEEVGNPIYVVDVNQTVVKGYFTSFNSDGKTLTDSNATFTDALIGKSIYRVSDTDSTDDSPGILRRPDGISTFIIKVINSKTIKVSGYAFSSIHPYYAIDNHTGLCEPVNVIAESLATNKLISPTPIFDATFIGKEVIATLSSCCDSPLRDTIVSIESPTVAVLGSDIVTTTGTRNFILKSYDAFRYIQSSLRLPMGGRDIRVFVKEGTYRELLRPYAMTMTELTQPGLRIWGNVNHTVIISGANANTPTTSSYIGFDNNSGGAGIIQISGVKFDYCTVAVWNEVASRVIIDNVLIDSTCNISLHNSGGTSSLQITNSTVKCDSQFLETTNCSGFFLYNNSITCSGIFGSGCMTAYLKDNTFTGSFDSIGGDDVIVLGQTPPTTARPTSGLIHNTLYRGILDSGFVNGGLRIYAPDNPRIILSEGDSAISYSTIVDLTNSAMAIQKRSSSGTATIFLDPVSLNGTSNAKVTLFRNINTSGIPSLDLLLGNNTSTINSSLVGTGNSYLNANNGSVFIGSTTDPGSGNKFAVTGNTYLTGKIKFGSNTTGTFSVSPMQMFADTTTQKALYYDAYLVRRTVDLSWNTLLDSIIVTGTASETNLDTVIMGANYPAPAKYIVSQWGGHYNASAGGSKTFIFRVKKGTTLIDSVTVTTPPGGSTDEEVEITSTISFKSIGSSANIHSRMKVISENGAKLSSHTASINTTTENLFILSVQISDATAGNDFTLDQAWSTVKN